MSFWPLAFQVSNILLSYWTLPMNADSVNMHVIISVYI